jgi:hypothetical protein
MRGLDQIHCSDIEARTISVVRRATYTEVALAWRTDCSTYQEQSDRYKIAPPKSAWNQREPVHKTGDDERSRDGVIRPGMRASSEGGM